MNNIGTILHGALGDYYEQILCLQRYKQYNPEAKLIAFFAVENRLRAFRHFDLTVFDEIHLAKDLLEVPVDEFYQLQVRDTELQEYVIQHLPEQVRMKFDQARNLLPWHIIKCHDFNKSPLQLGLSERGKRHLRFVKEISGIDEYIPGKQFTVGFLWRYRKKGSINSFGQYSREVVFNNINALLKQIVDRYNAHIIVCGMNLGTLESLPCYEDVVEEAGLALGERRNTMTDLKFDIPDESITYLHGAGYAAEMEIMSQCGLLITMPSGFSEPLWMRRRQPTIMVFPPLEYVLRLWKSNMPFFDHNTWSGRWYNTFLFHSPQNVMGHLAKMNYLPA